MCCDTCMTSPNPRTFPPYPWSGGVTKCFIGCLIFEGGDETDIVCDKENGRIGGVGSFNDTGRSFVRVDDARSHCCRAVADEGFWGRR